jgi:anaerobic C4-dicarboxylate transporter
MHVCTSLSYVVTQIRNMMCQEMSLYARNMRLNYNETLKIIMLYFSIVLHCIDLTLESLCPLRAMSVTIISSYSLIGQYMFQPNQPSVLVFVAMDKDSAAHCNYVIFPLIVEPG